MFVSFFFVGGLGGVMGFLLACEMQVKLEMVRCVFFFSFALWHLEVWPLEYLGWSNITKKITVLYHRAGKPETEVMFCRLKNTGGVGYTILLQTKTFVVGY